MNETINEIEKPSTFQMVNCNPINFLPQSELTDEVFLHELEQILKQYIDCQARHNNAQ